MINNAVLMGRLTRDPDLRTTQSGRNVCSFTIAVDRSFVRQGEERQADFIPCVAWGSTADFISRFFHKGSMIAVTGRIQTRSYDDNNGNKRNVTEIVVNEASFTGSKSETNTGASGSDSPRTQNAPAPAYQTADAADFEEITDDDDLPF